MTIVAPEEIINQLLTIAISTEPGKGILGAFIEGLIVNHEGVEKKAVVNIADGKLSITLNVPSS